MVVVQIALMVITSTEVMENIVFIVGPLQLGVVQKVLTENTKDKK
jgi:hypothetical protein